MSVRSSPRAASANRPAATRHRSAAGTVSRLSDANATDLRNPSMSAEPKSAGGDAHGHQAPVGGEPGREGRQVRGGDHADDGIEPRGPRAVCGAVQDTGGAQLPLPRTALGGGGDHHH